MRVKFWNHFFICLRVEDITPFSKLLSFIRVLVFVCRNEKIYLKFLMTTHPLFKVVIRKKLTVPYF